MASSRLKGHTLLYGGRCGTNVGPARCSCGAQSHLSYSRASERQAWHRAHKAAVLPSAADLDAVAAEQSITERTGQWTQPLKHEL
jgi:hypothetical protein